MPWAAYLWPGLPHLWNEGSWAGLGLAVGFTVLLNTLILAAFAWPEWLPERVRLACGAVTGLVWLVALIETRNELRRQAARLQSETTEAAPAGDQPAQEHVEGRPAPDRRLDELLRRAQRLYLAGDWVETERTLVRLLRLDRDDIEGQLLLAAVWRHSDRQRKARRLLARLARRQDAEAWAFEINDELARLAEASAGAADNGAADNKVEQDSDHDDATAGHVISLAKQRHAEDDQSAGGFRAA